MIELPGERKAEVPIRTTKPEGLLPEFAGSLEAPIARLPTGTGLPGIPTPPTDWQTLRAGFRQENLVINAIDALSRPMNPVDPDFNPIDEIKGTKYEANHMDHFIGIRSKADFDAMKGRIDREQYDRSILEAAGGAGVVTSIMGGAFDPTIFIPLGPVLKGAQAAKSGVKATVGAAAITGGIVGFQEAGLQKNQELRTAGESAINIGMGTIVGGILGKAANALSKVELENIGNKMNDVRNGMMEDPNAVILESMKGETKSTKLFDKLRGETALSSSRVIEPTTTTGPGLPKSAGSASSAAGRGTGELAGALGAEKALSRLGPTIQIQSSSFLQARNIGRELSEMGGLSLRENELFMPSSEGGAVESLVKQPLGRLNEAVENMDDAYARYWYGDGNEPKLGKRMRARIGSEWAQKRGALNGKLSAQEFRNEVGKAMNHGDAHPLKEVSEVAEMFRPVYDDLKDDAIRVGLLDRGVKVVGDESYLNRMYKREAIIADGAKWEEILLKHFKKQRVEAVKQLHIRNEGRRAQLNQEIEDLNLPVEKRAALLESLPEDLKRLESTNPSFVKLDQNIRALRERARNTEGIAASDEIRAEVKRLAENAGDSYAQYSTARTTINRRLRSVRGGIAGKESAVEKLRGKIADIENSHVTTLWKMHNSLSDIEKKIATADPEDLMTELDSLRNKFADLSDKSDAAYVRLAESKERLKSQNEDNIVKGKFEKAADAEAKLDKLNESFEKAQANRVGRQTETARAIDMLEQAEPEAVIRELRDLIERRLSLTAEYVGNSTKRMMGIMKRLEKSDPEIVNTRMVLLKERLKHGDYRSKLAEMDDLEAVDLVKEVTGHILGETPYRLTGLDLLSGPRGPLKKRVLNIKSDEIEDFLELDIEKLSRMYVRTMASDIALTRKFGDVHMSDPLDKLKDEFVARRSAATTTKERVKLEAEYNLTKKNIEGIRDRIRHLYGRPENPHGLLHRAAKAGQEINYFRLLGGMTLAAIPDLGKPIINYGLTSTFRDGWVPMTTAFGTFRLAAKEVKLAGTALDMTFDTRMRAMADLIDEWQRGSRVERGLETMSSTFGVVSLMAPWNATMKQMVGTIAMNGIFRASKAVSLGKATQKQIRLLASESIDEDMAKAIWKQYETRGGSYEDGLYLANTKNWDDRLAIDAFRAAIVREVDRTIVTPGQEMPLWMSKTLGKMIGQFKSFAMSSVQKTFLAGLQQRDGQLVNGVIASLALGGFSAWLRMQFAGYDTSSWTATKWAIEAGDRSGLLTLFSDANNMLEKVTGGIGLSWLTGEQASRYRSRNSFGAVLGPTFGLVGAGLGIAASAARGEWSAADSKTVRRLLPYSNLFYLRLLLDQVEEGFNDVMGIPQKKKT